jgi:hypothetical protein
MGFTRRGLLGLALGLPFALRGVDTPRRSAERLRALPEFIDESGPTPTYMGVPIVFERSLENSAPRFYWLPKDSYHFVR